MLKKLKKAKNLKKPIKPIKPKKPIKFKKGVISDANVRQKVQMAHKE